jgi:hypothetical protein
MTEGVEAFITAQFDITIRSLQFRGFHDVSLIDSLATCNASACTSMSITRAGQPIGQFKRMTLSFAGLSSRNATS